MKLPHRDNLAWRLSAGVTAGAVCLGVLAACGSSSNSSGSGKSPSTVSVKGPITWWVPSPDPVPGTSQGAAKAFTAKTGIKVNFDSTPWSDFLTKITSAITSHTGPDVVEIGNTWAPTFGRSGGFLPWTPSMYKSIGGKSQFVKTSMEVTGAPGKPAISVPYLAQTWVMLYNKGMFKSAGLTPPRTWSQFYTDAKKLNHPSKGVYAVANSYGSNSAMQTWLWIMSRQNGGSFYDSSGNPSFTSKANVTTFTQLLKWVYPDRILNPNLVADSTGTVGMSEFEKGKAAMMFSQSPSVPKTPPGGVGLSYIPLPSPTPPSGVKVMSHIAGENLAIFASSRHVKEDLEFIKFLDSRAENAKINQKMLELPVTHAALKTPYFQTPREKTFATIFNKYAKPMPTESSSATVENDYAGAFIKLAREDISHHGITASQVRSALSSAQGEAAASAGGGG